MGRVLGALHDPMFVRTSDPKPEQLAQWRKIATEIAKARLRCTSTRT